MKPGRGLSLGIALGGPRGPGDAVRALSQVERAEGLGLHSVWLPEGHFTRGAMPSPLVALAAFAARTRRLVLGTTSLLLPVRRAEQVADEVATLDRLSGGRVWLGLGRGFRAPLFAAFGVSRADKRDRFDSVLDAVLERWASATDTPGPLQEPHPPLLVAAFGRKGLLQAARRGLPYLASPLETLTTLEENYAYHRENLPETTDAGALPVAVMRAVHVARDDAEAERALEALRIETGRMAGALPPALVRAAEGDAGERAIVGTADQVVDQLAKYRERIGMDLLIVRSGMPGVSRDEAESALERLAGDVMPRLAS